jgi:hypothetical protein
VKYLRIIESELRLIEMCLSSPVGRKSISAMHNIDNKTTSISKSYTNSKKEELLKVINEAKQKLENVSIYRSVERQINVMTYAIFNRTNERKFIHTAYLFCVNTIKLHLGSESVS